MVNSSYSLFSSFRNVLPSSPLGEAITLGGAITLVATVALGVIGFLGLRQNKVATVALGVIRFLGLRQNNRVNALSSKNVVWIKPKVQEGKTAPQLFVDQKILNQYLADALPSFPHIQRALMFGLMASFSEEHDELNSHLNIFRYLIIMDYDSLSVEEVSALARLACAHRRPDVFYELASIGSGKLRGAAMECAISHNNLTKLYELIDLGKGEEPIPGKIRGFAMKWAMEKNYDRLFTRLATEESSDLSLEDKLKITDFATKKGLLLPKEIAAAAQTGTITDTLLSFLVGDEN